MNFITQEKKSSFFKNLLGIVIVCVFLLSSFTVTGSSTTPTTTNNFIQTQSIPKQSINLGSATAASTLQPSLNLQNNLDNALFNWINNSIPLNPANYRMDPNNNPIITVFALPGSNLQAINQNMAINSFVDLGMYGYIILGSANSPTNLVSMVQSNPLIKISSDPYGSYLDSLYGNTPAIQQNAYTPSDFVSNDQMFIPQANAMNCGGLSCNGTGVTIAMVDGGTDFGSSDLEPAMALDSQGLPKSFDTESWSLVATPLTVGKDIPISSDNTTLLFNKVPSTTLDKLRINSDISQSWQYWNQYENFMAPQNWIINATWISQPNQAPPKFGVGVEQWKDLYTDNLYYGYFYALLIDLNHDGLYDSVVIDMQTSAWASYLKYVADGGHVTPLSSITPDFNFANNKIVTWETNTAGNRTAVGKDYTFAIDWNNDGSNDWSYGSLANAYNRFGFLPVNQSTQGAIIHGVDPQGSGFASLYPYGNGFSEHGSWTASVAVSRGIVNYNVFSNNTGSWDYPFGNSSTRTIQGAASGAQLMSLAFGASPQDELVAWFWAAGFDLNSTISQNTADITGAQWKWSGHLRANITSNSWGVGGVYWGGFWGTDWTSDLLSLTNMGGGMNYMRDIQDIFSNGVMNGSTTSNTALDFNYTSAPLFTVNNQLYLGGNNAFNGFGLNVSVVDNTNLNIIAEYYTGTDWKTLPYNQSSNLKTLGTDWFTFDIPTDWKLNNFTINGNVLYWIRLTVSSSSNLQVSNIFIQFPNPYYGYPGMLMVAAAGNDGYYQSTGSPFGTLTLKVGASSSSDAYANQYGPNWNGTSDQMAYFSSAGPKASGAPAVDVVSPGFLIYSGTPPYHSLIDNRFGPGQVQQFGGNGNNSYIIWAGTSSSTPAVAGVAAIAYQAYMAQHPGQQVNPMVIKQIIKSTSTNMKYPSINQGAGFINASAIVDYINNPTTAKYFLIGSNATYESQLNISYWLKNFIYGFYAYTPAEPLTDVFDFPVTRNSLLASTHFDDDLSTTTITKGVTYNTQVSVSNSGAKNIDASAVRTVLNNTITTTDTITSSDLFQGQKGDYLVNLSLANLNMWSADFVQITVTNAGAFDNVSFFTWYDYNHDGKMQMADYNNPQTNGAGELARVQYQSIIGKDYAVLQVGNPGQYNNAFNHPYIILRGNTESNDVYNSTWAVGQTIGISVKIYRLYADWSNAIKITTSSSTSTQTTWDVAIDTSTMSAGFNGGFIKFTDTATNYTEYMPLSVKVSYGQIDKSDPATNPNANPTTIGTYNIPYIGSPFQIGLQGGSMIWVPFSVDESKTTTNSVLAIRVTQESPTDSISSLGFVLHYDGTPNYFDSYWFQIFTSYQNTGVVNGKNVNWQYIPWSQVGFEQGAFINRFGYIRYQNQSDPQVFNYRIGLFTTNASAQTNVKLEMYWLPNMPVTYSQASGPSAGSYCRYSYQTNCLETSNILIGPDAQLSVQTVCNPCDPNLPQPTVLYNKVAEQTVQTTGTFPNGFDPSYSIDMWEKRHFEAGDLVEFSLLPTNPSAKLNTWIFTPDTLAFFNQTLLNQVPITDLGILLSADMSFYEQGAFIASTTGDYWFGIDNFGTVNTGWMLFTKVSRGSLQDAQTNNITINTGTDSQFGLSTEATYDLQTGLYDNVTNVVIGAKTPTGLSTNIYSLDLAIDNLVAPFINLSNMTLDMNNTVVYRDQGGLLLNWSVADINGNTAESQVFLQGPMNKFYQSTLSTTTGTVWNYTSATDFPSGWWTIYIAGNDANDPQNVINGVNYGGYGFPVSITVFLTNRTVSGNLDLVGAVAFTAIGAIAGGSIGVLSYIRRDDIKARYGQTREGIRNKYGQVRENVNTRIQSRRNQKEGPKD